MSDSNKSSLINDDEGDFGEGDFFCAEAIVAKNDDPENRCRIQCVVPIIDEDELHEVWARRFQLYVGENNFGDYFIPEVGAEVLLIGRFGDTNNLFYTPLYNEERKPSSDFPDKSAAGIKVPQDLKFIAGELLRLQAKYIESIAAEVAKILAKNIEIKAQNNIEIEAQNLAEFVGQNVTVQALQNNLLKGNSIQVEGATISIQSDGSLSISGDNISISGTSVTIEGRPVKKVGPPI